MHRGMRLAILAGGCAALLLAGLSNIARAVPPARFAPPVSYPAGAGPIDVAVGDLDRDGRPDLVTANANAGTVSVLLGTGGGAFAPPVDYTVGPDPNNVAVGDLNGDGWPDIAVTHFEISQVWILLNRGDGTFGAAVASYPAPAGTGGLVLADLNGDGRLDLVTGGHFDNVLAVRLGNGDGTFGERQTFPAGEGTDYVAVADMNGDGRPDLVTSNRWGDGTSVLLGNGDGTLAAPIHYMTGAWPYGVVARDVNHDGRPDVVVANHDGGFFVSVFPGNGDGTLGARADYPLSWGANGLASGDFNLDGSPDVVSAVYPGRFCVLLGDGAGGFLPPFDVTTPTMINRAAVADLDGDGRPDLVGAASADNLVWVARNTSGTTIAPQPPATCITPATACVDVPVTIANRPDATPVRGYSVTLQLAGGLALCGAGATEGDYLAGTAPTHFAITDRGGGLYTFDDAILGNPCGATAAGGTLFTLHLGSAASTGIGTVTVTAVLLRDCANLPLLVSAGAPASVAIDNEVPGAIALAAAQRRSGNAPGDRTAIDLAWTGAVAASDTVIVFRAPYGNAPEYGGGGGVPALPTWPPGAPWARAAALVGVTAYADVPPARDFWYYVACVRDACGNVGPISARTAGALDYFLGDVSDGAGTCAGNNGVGMEDISLLGSHYGIPLAMADPLACLDVGPTSDFSSSALPLPDDWIGFEDLMIFALDFHVVSGTTAAMPAPAERNELWVDAPGAVRAGETFTATLWLRGAGDLQGVSAQLGWDPGVVEPTGTVVGDFVAAQGGAAFSARPGGVDAAALGASRRLAGEGVLATVTFRALAAGAPQVTLARVDARDGNNRPATLGPRALVLPANTALAAPTPNPFHGTTTIAWTLATPGRVELAIYGVDGRRVVELAGGTQPAGTYSVTWDGRDAHGRPARPGVYWARLVTPQARFSRTVVLTR